MTLREHFKQEVGKDKDTPLEKFMADNNSAYITWLEGLVSSYQNTFTKISRVVANSTAICVNDGPADC